MKKKNISREEKDQELACLLELEPDESINALLNQDDDKHVDNKVSRFFKRHPGLAELLDSVVRSIIGSGSDAPDDDDSSYYS